MMYYYIYPSLELVPLLTVMRERSVGSLLLFKTNALQKDPNVKKS